MSLTLTNVPPKAAELIRSKSAQVDRMKEAAKEQVEDAIDTVEVVGTAFAVSYATAYYPDKAKFEGIPTGVIVSGLAYLSSFWASKTYSKHLRAIGKGALASSAADAGREMGNDRRLKAQSTTVSGVLPFRRSA